MLGGRFPETGKEKNMSNVWPKRWSLTREFLNQSSTEKQNGYLQSGRLLEVVSMRELTVVANEMSRGGIPLFGLYGDVPLNRVWFFSLVVLNRVYNI